jgi:hypothetical protein
MNTQKVKLRKHLQVRDQSLAACAFDEISLYTAVFIIRK